MEAHAVVRLGLVHVLEAPCDLEVVGRAAAAAAARDLVRRQRPDVVVLGLNLPDDDALETMRDIRAARAEGEPPRFLVFGIYDDALFAERCLQLGASGYLRRDADPDELLQAVRTVLAGDVHLGDAARTRILARLAEGAEVFAASALSTLTERERQVFRLVGQGRTTRQIAAVLELSPKTVETHRAKLMRKLGVESSTELLQRAVEWRHRDEDAPEPSPEAPPEAPGA